MGRRSVLMFAIVAGLLAAARAESAQYEVGPGKAYGTPSEVPWESIAAGDTVLIYWRSEPYHDKWIICAQGTAEAPITVRGVAGPNGERPVIDAAGAVTRAALNYWNQDRGAIKIGGGNIPADTLPQYIVIEGLEVRGARAGNTFLDFAGGLQGYLENAAGIWVEKGHHITVRGNRLQDNGNGLVVSAGGDILVEKNEIFGNGYAGSAFQHNVYTSVVGITFQFNHFGPMKPGSDGANIKDRSAGLVVRYNWLEGGNRVLDLVETSEPEIAGLVEYGLTYVYGNVLIKHASDSNSQVIHYGGDSGGFYRPGSLFFYHNTVVSYRPGTTTLFSLSTPSQHADARNNIFYVTSAGSNLGLVGAYGVLTLSSNWIKPGYVWSFVPSLAVIADLEPPIVSLDPGFLDEGGQDFRLADNSAAAGAAGPNDPSLPNEHRVASQYAKHLQSEPRPNTEPADVGAFESAATSIPQPPPPPGGACTPSPPGTRRDVVCDAGGARWTLGPSGETLRNGVHVGGGYGSVYWVLMLDSGLTISTFGTDNAWWTWNGSAWVRTG